jgi:hypothetical protein
MKFADQVPNIYAASERYRLSRVVLISGSTGSSSHHQYLDQPCKPIRLQKSLCGRSSWSTITAIVLQDRPSDPRQLVGNGDLDDAGWAAGQERVDPSRSR